MTPFWHPSRVMVSFFLTLGLLGAVTLAFWLYVRAEQGITLALEERHASLTLAAELRQSSEALTRMARSYTVTGNPVFKDLYQNILDIREGNQPRPGQFADISWDLASAGRATPPATGPRVPLLDLIRQTGLPEVEYRLLEAAKTASDQLTAREFQAMALMETGGSDAQADREAARNLLFDATYYQAKADILQLIQAFITRVDQRTAERVKTAVAQAAFMRHVSIACGLALVLMLGLTWAALGRVLGASPLEVQGHIARLGQGDFTTAFPVSPGRENSVIGWLAETRRKLLAAEHAQARAVERYREAAERLRASEERLRRMLEHLPTAIAISTLDETQRVLFCNSQFVRTFGYTPADIPTVADWARLAYPDADYRNATFAWWGAALARAISAQGQVESREFRVSRRDGQQREVLISGAVVDDMLIIALVDITERKAMEAQLRASEERFRLLATHALDNLWTMGLDYRLRYISPSIETLVGYTVEEYLALTLEQQLMPDSLALAQVYFTGLHERLARGASVADYPFRGEIQLRAKEGPPVWTEIIATPLVDEAGRMLELAGVTRDIRERKRYEAELHQAREAAEAANRTKSAFLAHMSHEIRTPLNGVLGMAQLLAQEPLDANQQALVARIREAGTTLLGILNDLLDLSKIEAGQLRLESQPLDLAALMAKVVGLLDPVARAKGVELRLEPPPTPLPPVMGDPLRLEQVLINLGGNAIKFTEQGQVIIQFGSSQHGAGASGERLCFEVWDNGIGIAPEALPTLFTPFTQADAGISRRYGGTGLGLAISKRLVELMGGEIGVESQVGMGSTFWFELPLILAHDGLEIPPALPAPPAGGGPNLTGLGVLVVDDTELNRMMLEHTLTRRGAWVTLAENGQQALDLLRAGPQDYGVVLMDVQMPVMDGLTATRLLRGDPALAHLPVIALTAGILPEELAATREAGVDAVLTKPLDLDELAALLSTQLEHRVAAA